jgi:hypothetical protein
MSFDGGLTDIAGNEAGAVDLDEVPFFQQAEISV